MKQAGGLPVWSMADKVHSKEGIPQQGQAPKAESATVNERPSRPIRVLAVEDDFFVSLEMETALTAAGFHVIGPAKSAEEAERFAVDECPDLAVMDIRLLGARDGIDAAITIFKSRSIPHPNHGLQ